jgi:hypothetical protein
VADRLRLFLNRPLQDGDRPRLFAIAVAVIAAAAGVLTLLDDAGPARGMTRETPPPAADVAPSSTAAAIVPASTPQAPSEESDPARGTSSQAHRHRAQQARCPPLPGRLPALHLRPRARSPHPSRHA